MLICILRGYKKTVFFFCCFIIGICFIMFLLLSVHVVCLAELNERCLVPKVVSKGQTYGEA